MRRSVDRLPAGICRFGGDVCDREALQKVILEWRPQAIVVSLTPAAMSDEGYRDSYVAGAEALLAAISETALSPLVLWVSSTGVYGQDAGEWVSEESDTQPGNYRGRRLLEAETVLQTGAKAAGFTVSVVRFSGIYGPGRNRLLNNVRSGKLADASKPQWTNRIHSDDCAGVLVHLLSIHQGGHPLAQCYVATDNEPTLAHLMQRELADMLKRAPAGSANAEAAGMVEATGRRCSNRRISEAGYRLLYPSWREGYGAMLNG